MTKFEMQFFSIIFIGKLNPQILTHEFLTKNSILPKDIEPFKSLLKSPEQQQFTEFISTPVITTIKYHRVTIVIEPNRFQIMDHAVSDPSKSSIIPLTKNYFSQLVHTPLDLAGINFNGKIIFERPEDEKKFDKHFGIDHKELTKLTETDDIRFAIGISYPWEDGMIEVQLPKPKDRNQPGTINFNFEYKFSNMKDFLSHLDITAKAFDRFKSLLRSLEIQVQ